MTSQIPTSHILLVEDDANLARFVEGELQLEGYQVTVAATGLDGLRAARAEPPPDLLILDWMLPGLSGLDLCLRLRETGLQAPIVLLTARDEIPDRVAGLNAGADDYVVKPFSIAELLARVRAHLRRAYPDQPDGLQFEDLTLNGLTREVHRGGDRIDLTAKEFDLLEFLLRHPRQVMPRDRLLESVWGYDFGGESNIVEVYIRALRIKLEMADRPRLIHTVRGVGYVLRDYA
ncbi:MAG TPA: response regulator transcription factor [Coleofasciculaceae cyanobacterium]